MSAQFDEKLRARLARLANKDRFRALSDRAGVDLSSNDYLGLTHHPRIQAALTAAVAAQTPLGSTGSRLLRGNDPHHVTMERRLASFKGTPAALIFNSGYDANLGVITTLCGKSDIILADALVHASMIDGIRACGARWLSFGHNDMTDLAAKLAGLPKDKQIFIAVESLYSMEGDRAPLADLAELADRYNALLIVDEAHATGVFGPHGAGLTAAAGIANLPVATIHTCGKAWGSFGAFVTCSQTVREYLINCCRHFIFTTAPPPLLMVQWQAVMDVIRDEPHRAARALALAATFRRGVADRLNTLTSSSQIVPVVLGADRDALAAARRLQDAGFDVRAIRPPTVPRGTARLRLAFNAQLTDGQLDDLIEVCRQL